MNRSEPLTDELIQAAFERRAGRATPRDLRDDILALTAATSQQAAWRLRLANSLSAPVLRPARLVLLVLMALLVAALGLALIGQQSHRPHPGLLAYVQDGDVYLANADGSAAVRVVHDPGVVFEAPLWSPDGRWLALEANGSVFLLDPGTLELRRIAAGRNASWSSDGQSLAFAGSSQSGSDVSDVIDIVRADSGALRELQPKLGTGTSLNVPLAWSPDGRWFLTRADRPTSNRFVRIDAATGDSVDIAPMPHLTEPGAHWSPDSRRFAYARPDACDTPQNPPCLITIVVEDAELSRAVPITEPALNVTSPIWSPDGAWIAFMSATHPGYRPDIPGILASDTTLSIIRPDGGDRRDLVLTAAQKWSWSPDGTALEFLKTDPSSGSPLGIFEVRISDGAMSRVAVAAGLGGYDGQAIPVERRAPTLPAPLSVSSYPAQSIVPLSSPPPAPPADPSGSWSGIAVDGYCAILKFDTMTQHGDGRACRDSGGGRYDPDGAVFAPSGAMYALSESDGSITVVGSGGSATKDFAGLGTLSTADPVQVDLAWSPDGRWLSVDRCIQRATGPCIDPAFVVVSADGRSQRQLPGPASWSPDGRRLVVAAPNGDLLVGSPDGSNLGSIGAFPMPISWSPDATRFAFVRGGDAWVVNMDGTGERNMTHFAHGGAYDVDWSPDGRFIAVIQESRLVIVRLAGGDLVPIDLGPGRIRFYDDASWSPDSSRLAVTAQQGDSPKTMIVQTEDWAPIALGGDDVEPVAWSPDGRWMALRGSSAGAIDVANRDGSGRHTVWTPNGGGGSGRITWVP